MTGLKGSSTLGKTEVTFPHPSFKGDTVQFTTEVLGNADHIHVAANGPYHQGPQKDFSPPGHRRGDGPAHQLNRPALVPADSSNATSALITARPVDANRHLRLLIAESAHVPCRQPGLICRRESSRFQFQR